MRKLVIFLLIILLLTGCSDVQNSDDEIKLLETNIKKLEVENYELKEENEKLQNMVVNANKKISEIVNSNQLLSEQKEEDPLKKEVEEFLRRELDKVVVSEYEDDPQSIEITDSSIISAIQSHLLGMYKLESLFPVELYMMKFPAIMIFIVETKSCH